MTVPEDASPAMQSLRPGFDHPASELHTAFHQGETEILEGESRDLFGNAAKALRNFDQHRLDVMSPSPRSGRDYTKVYVRNRSRDTIWVAIRYEPYQTPGTSKLAVIDEDGPFDTHAWYKLTPGARKHLANTPNFRVYVYAESQTGRSWGGSHRRRVGNRTLGFALQPYVGNPREYTINLN